MRNVKYMIHLCPERKWYVDEFLIPKIKERGIDPKDMLLYFDERKEGYLKSLMNEMKECSDIKEDTFIWHLQDDVYPRSDFYERSLSVINDYDIVCGYCNPISKFKSKSGDVAKEEMWWSFPCIGMTNLVSRAFVNWWDVNWNKKKEYEMYIREKKFGDQIFRDFVNSGVLSPEPKCFNMRPVLAQSVDEIIGGSVINQSRHKFFGSSETLYFEEEIEKEFRKGVKERYKEILKERNNRK